MAGLKGVCCVCIRMCKTYMGCVGAIVCEGGVGEAVKMNERGCVWCL